MADSRPTDWSRLYQQRAQTGNLASHSDGEKQTVASTVGSAIALCAEVLPCACFRSAAVSITRTHSSSSFRNPSRRRLSAAASPLQLPGQPPPRRDRSASRPSALPMREYKCPAMICVKYVWNGPAAVNGIRTGYFPILCQIVPFGVKNPVHLDGVSL